MSDYRSDQEIVLPPELVEQVKETIKKGKGYHEAYEAIGDYLETIDADADRQFWFEQATHINAYANGLPVKAKDDSAAVFVVATTSFGLQANDRQADITETTNDIAKNVLEDIARDGKVPSFDAMLKEDIAAALGSGKQNIAGWGGGLAIPLAIDLDGDGLETIAFADSDARYDLDQDGFLEKTSWISGDDGWLAYDANQDGKIEGLAEISPAYWVEQATGKQVSDWQGLAEYFDSNQDGVFDAKDDEFHKFGVWQDKNGCKCDEIHGGMQNSEISVI